jgi:hypothetical protein
VGTRGVLSHLPKKINGSQSGQEILILTSLAGFLIFLLTSFHDVVFPKSSLASSPVQTSGKCEKCEKPSNYE